jgi:hypothetical protein
VENRGNKSLVFEMHAQEEIEQLTELPVLICQVFLLEHGNILLLLHYITYLCCEGNFATDNDETFRVVGKLIDIFFCFVHTAERLERGQFSFSFFSLCGGGLHIFYSHKNIIGPPSTIE